jgi:hypothetical protein
MHAAVCLLRVSGQLLMTCGTQPPCRKVGTLEHVGETSPVTLGGASEEICL